MLRRDRPASRQAERTFGFPASLGATRVRAMDDFQLSLFRAAIEIEETGAGNVGGVTVDLRHPDLPVSEWRHPWLRLAICSDGQPFRSFEPTLLFPWQRKFDWAKGGKPWAKPDALIDEGDILRVSDVDIDRFPDSDFDHIHDAEARFVRLAIHRKSGEKITLEKPLLFVGTTSFRLLNFRDEFDSLGLRICGYFGVRTLDDVSASLKGNAAEAAQRMKNALLCVTTPREVARRWLSGKEPELLEAHRTWVAIDDAMMAGYYWAKAEAELNLKPLAVATLDRKQNARKAGRDSGKARRQKAAAEWQDRALDLAKAERVKEPALSQNKLAERIAVVPDVPGYDTIKAFLSACERSGALAKPKRPIARGLHKVVE